MSDRLNQTNNNRKETNVMDPNVYVDANGCAFEWDQVNKEWVPKQVEYNGYDDDDNDKKENEEMTTETMASTLKSLLSLPTQIPAQSSTNSSSTSSSSTSSSSTKASADKSSAKTSDDQLMQPSTSHEVNGLNPSNSKTIEWLNNEISKFIGEYNSTHDEPYYLTLEIIVETVLNWLTATNKSDEEIGQELYNLLGDSCFSLIEEIINSRKGIVKSYNSLYQSETIKETKKEVKPMQLVQSQVWDKKPVFAQTVVVQTEEEKQLKKQLRKVEKKFMKELSKEHHMNDNSNLNEIEKIKKEKENNLLKAMYGPLFKNDPSQFMIDPNEYPYVFDSYTQAKCSSAYIGDSRMLLPHGFKRNDERCWEEIVVPAAQPPSPEITDRFKLVSIENDIDEFGKIAFKGTKSLNLIQSIVYKTAYFTNENMLICAPTGAGKTNVAMLAVLHEIKLHATGVSSIQYDQFKIVYIAPMKALASEMTDNFSSRLAPMGIKVKELTGDMQLTKKEIMETQIIVTTPEKWDVVTRKAKGDVNLLELVRLIIIDEVHLLQSDRGPVLESLVARTIRYVESSQNMIRLVGLSATLPNYKDVADFLHVNSKEGLFVFDSRFRPVPLSQTFIGCKATCSRQQNRNMDEVTYEKVREMILKGHQVMVFVQARNSTYKTAMNLREQANLQGHKRIFECDTSKMHDSERMIRRAKNQQLVELFQSGFAIHHAGMLRVDRNLVETLFRAGVIKVLICTATLAWGVNLPAHCVIIRGTEMYDSSYGNYVDLGILDVMQIFGRAGRPQYDTEGHGIIITSHNRLGFYLSLLTSQFPIESNFHKYITDNMNAEIVSGTISTIYEAIDWLGYTYYYIRMKKNPIIYGIDLEFYKTDPTLSEFREKIIRQSAEALDKAKMIRYNPEAGTLDPTDLGRTASHFYIKYDTIEKFNDMITDYMDLVQALHMISQAQEFDQLKSREEEFDELHKLREECKLQVPVGVEERHGKVNILIQTTLSRARIDSFSLVSDKMFIIQNAKRIARGLFEYLLKKGCSFSAGTFLSLSIMLEREVWGPPFGTPFNQFEQDIPYEIMKKIQCSKLDINKIYSGELKANEIGRIVRFQKYGQIIERLTCILPYIEINPKIRPITRTILQVHLEITPNFFWDDRYHGKNYQAFWVWITDTESDHIYHSEFFKLRKKQVIQKQLQHLLFNIPLLDCDHIPPQYIVYALSDHWLGCEYQETISCSNLILPEKYVPYTKLLDLDPLPITALQNPLYESLYKFNYFNPIQTQIFHTLFHTDFNVLLGAPTGSGKTIAAEIAMLRLFNVYPNSKVVYIAPLKALVRERVDDWKQKIQKNIGHRVVELTGDVMPDKRAIIESDIIVTTPEKWDGVSRGWQTRKYVHDVGLMIIDEIHLLGEDRGPVLEVIVSRANYISEKTGRELRIIGLSTAIANSQDLASWLNIKKVGLYNFKPSVRPVPIEVHVHGYPGKNYCPRMALMNKPTFRGIIQHSPNKPVLVFVSSRRQTRLTAQDLIAFLAQTHNQTQWLHMPEQEIEMLISSVRDTNLRLTLSFGIGLHHAGLHEKDRCLVEELFTNQKIQVLITTATLAWGVNLPAHAVIIKGTEYYDGKTQRYVDFPITDVLQMMGRAGRPQYDTSGVAVILVHDIKKEYYKKFLYEPFPVESSLLSVLPDHFNAEIASGTIKSKQDCIQYLNWTYLFRRITKNPSYYGIEGFEEIERDVNLYLSSKIDEALQTLVNSYCVIIDEDDEREVSPTPLGCICSYYYIHHSTIKMLNDKLNENNDLNSIIQLLSDSHEYNELPVRHNEDLLNSQLAQSCPIKLTHASYDSSHTKANLLLQAHFSRLPLPSTDYFTDLKSVLDQALRILQAMIDVAANYGYLSTTLTIVSLEQMIVQGSWINTSSLLAIPCIDLHNLHVISRAGSSVARLVKFYMEKGFQGLNNILKNEFRNHEIDQIANYLSRLPVIDLKVSISKKNGNNFDSSKQNNGDSWLNQQSGKPVSIEFYNQNIPMQNRRWIQIEPETDYIFNLNLLRKGTTETNNSKAITPKFPKQKDEGWFLIVGEIETGELIALKRIPFINNKQQQHKRGNQFNQKLEFTSPSKLGRMIYTIYLLSDSYIGLDQQYDVYLEVVSKQ